MSSLISIHAYVLSKKGKSLRDSIFVTQEISPHLVEFKVSEIKKNGWGL
jgi:hypothetical protein